MEVIAAIKLLNAAQLLKYRLNKLQSKVELYKVFTERINEVLPVYVLQNFRHHYSYAGQVAWLTPFLG